MPENCMTSARWNGRRGGPCRFRRDIPPTPPASAADCSSAATRPTTSARTGLWARMPPTDSAVSSCTTSSPPSPCPATCPVRWTAPSPPANCRRATATARWLSWRRKSPPWPPAAGLRTPALKSSTRRRSWARTVPTVIDYKFGQPEKKYLDQVRGYMDLYRALGHSPVSGTLWYIHEDGADEIVEVR